MPVSRSQDHAQHHAATVAGPQRTTGSGRTTPGSFAHVILAGLLLIALPAMGLTQQAGPGQPVAQADYRTGVVTANNGTVLRIDGRDYRLDPGVTVTDEDGSVYAIQDLKRGEQVKFHLRNRKIDQIIWILPR